MYLTSLFSLIVAAVSTACTSHTKLDQFTLYNSNTARIVSDPTLYYTYNYPEVFLPSSFTHLLALSGYHFSFADSIQFETTVSAISQSSVTVALDVQQTVQIFELRYSIVLLSNQNDYFLITSGGRIYLKLVQ